MLMFGAAELTLDMDQLHCGKAFCYSVAILEAHNTDLEVNVMLCDMRSIRLYSARTAGNSSSYTYSPYYSLGESGLDLLYSWLLHSSLPHQPVYRKVSLSGLPSLSDKGRIVGSGGSAVSLVPFGGPFVKHFSDPSEAEYEAAAFARLNLDQPQQYAFSWPFPKLLGADGPDLTLSPFAREITTQELGIMFRKPRFIQSVFAALQLLAERGVAHCDLAPRHFFTHSPSAPDDVLLVDFGFWNKIGSSADFRGSSEFAADSAVKAAQAGEEYEVTATDDQESFVKVWLAAVVPAVHDAVSKLSSRDYGGILDFWQNQAVSLLPRPFSTAFQLRRGDRTALLDAVLAANLMQ